MTSKKRRIQQIIGMLALCICGAAVYELPYLSWTFYDGIVAYFKVTDAQMGYLMSVYGIACVISYLPAGWVADCFKAKHLIALALLSTSAVGAVVALFPSYPVLLVCYALYGITTTVPLWSAMMKATRELGDSKEMGRLYGFLEGGRGLIPVAYGAIIIPIFSKMGEGAEGIPAVYIYYIALGVLCSLLALFGIKKLRSGDEEDTIKNESTKHTFHDYLNMMKNKSLWLLTLLMFCCFMIYESYSLITPYLTEFFGVSESLAAVISLIKSYGLAVFGGIAAGFVADKLHSNAKVISWGFGLMILATGIFFTVPATPQMFVIAAVTILVLSLGLFMVRALYFAVIDEINIPLKYTGMAVGFASVLGCLPQTFIYSVAGNLLDKYEGTATGYKYMFAYMFTCAAIGAISALLLHRNIKKSAAKAAKKAA